METEASFKLGEKVKTRLHKYEGIISKVHEKCPQDNEWLSKQEVPIHAEAINDYWYSINVIPEGAVVVPEYDIFHLCHYCRIDDYENDYYNDNVEFKICKVCKQKICNFCDGDDCFQKSSICIYCQMIKRKNDSINLIKKLHQSVMYERLNNKVCSDYAVFIDQDDNIDFVK